MTTEQEPVCRECAGDPRDGNGYHAYGCSLRLTVANPPQGGSMTREPVCQEPGCGHGRDQHDSYGCRNDLGGCNSPSRAYHYFHPPQSPRPMRDALERGAPLDEVDALAQEAIRRDMARGAAPQEGSSVQEAREDGWRKKREDGDFGVWADFYQNRPISPFYVVPHGVESAIRAQAQQEERDRVVALIEAARAIVEDERTEGGYLHDQVNMIRALAAALREVKP